MMAVVEANYLVPEFVDENVGIYEPTPSFLGNLDMAIRKSAQGR